MASLLNTSWTFNATQRDFTPFTVQFQGNNAASVTFTTDMEAQGTWSEDNDNFTLQFTVIPRVGGSEAASIVGTHEDGQGSGTATWNITNANGQGGVQNSPFTMVKT